MLFSGKKALHGLQGLATDVVLHAFAVNQRSGWTDSQSDQKIDHYLMAHFGKIGQFFTGPRQLYGPGGCGLGNPATSG